VRLHRLLLAIFTGWLAFQCSQTARAQEAPAQVLPLPRVVTEVPIFVEPPGPPPPPAPKLWCGGVEFGVNGADGNSEIFKTRLGFETKRETPDNIFKLDFAYNFATANSVETENRALLNSRYEWLFADSPWSLFTSGTMEYDAFKEFDVRLAAHAGVGRQLLKTERLQLKGRVGAGASREIGGVNNHVTPEALFGADFEYKVSGRQKFTATLDVFPDLRDFGEYRAQARLAYELLVDPEWNLTLKIGAFDRYDSTPDGKRRNDIDYFAVLLWKF
jgi:putative salt-induced outer membrane protein YdiY